MKTYRLLLACVLLLSANRATACAIAYKEGQGVATAEEQALIVWNPETKTQDFIRKVRFDASADDFGFLVPTPTKPEIEESSDEVFKYLKGLFPEPDTRGAPAAGSAFTRAGGPAPVQVLEEKRVGSFDVAVLKASDSSSLLNWLNTNGYKVRESFEPWLARLVTMDWVLTAFKYVGGPEASAVSINPVRMTFQTDTPFFPYHEPADVHASGSRSMELYVVAPEPLRATRGRANWDYVGNRGARSASFDLTHLKGIVPAKSMPSYTATVTQFRDFSEKRQPGDLFFSPVAKN